LKVESESGTLFSTVSGRPTSQCSYGSTEDIIEINGLFAAKQGLKNGQVVGKPIISSTYILASCFSDQKCNIDVTSAILVTMLIWYTLFLHINNRYNVLILSPVVKSILLHLFDC